MIKETLHDNGLLELIIDAPPVNAFSLELLDRLSSRLEAVWQQETARIVILTGEGTGFCGGGDIKEVEALEGFEGILGHASGALRLSLAMLECPLPVITAVHGYCIGIGVIVAASADILVSSRGTRFVLAEIDNGATAGAIHALRLMPEKRVRAAMMTADPILAEELHAYGAIYELAPAHTAVRDSAIAIAAKIADKNAEAMRRLKQSLNNGTRVAELKTLFRAEISYTYELNMLGEARDGRKSFLTGRRRGYNG